MMKKSFESKLLTAAAAGTVAALPAAADAALVVVNGPIKVAMSDPAGSTSWDVDRDGNADFAIINRDSTDIEYLSVTSAGMNGRGFVGTAGNKPAVVELGFGVTVGPTLATNIWGLADTGRQVGAHTVTFSAPALGQSWLTRTQEPVFVGFRFDSGRGLQYGWASMQLDFDGSRTSLTVHQWAYETAPDTAVVAGTVDAPASGIAALTMLGLGAAGMRRWRAKTVA